MIYKQYFGTKDKQNDQELQKNYDMYSSAVIVNIFFQIVKHIITKIAMFLSVPMFPYAPCLPYTLNYTLDDKVNDKEVWKPTDWKTVTRIMMFRSLNLFP